MTELALTGGAGPKPRWRRGVARVRYSPAGRFRTVVFQPGETKRIGRDERADVRIADPALRGAHFELYFDGLRFHAKDLSSDATIFVDGKPARFGELHNGGFVRAGHTTLALHVERWTPPPVPDDPAPAASAEHTARVRDALAQLSPAREAGTLYGVFDAAREARILTLLSEGVDDHASLYEGDQGAVMDDVAPYLVRFAPDSQLLERLLEEGWGRAWGVFAVSALGAKDVRRHFRRFLMVKDETTNERMYFRFYDPRVFREFYRVATPRQREELIFGLSAMLLESGEGDVLRFVPDGTAAPVADPAAEDAEA